MDRLDRIRFGHSSLERQRKRLPVYKHRDAVLYLVEHHSTTIVVGETGSGKTTQIPQVVCFVVVVLVVVTPFVVFVFAKEVVNWNCDCKLAYWGGHY